MCRKSHPEATNTNGPGNNVVRFNMLCGAGESGCANTSNSDWLAHTSTQGRCCTTPAARINDINQLGVPPSSPAGPNTDLPPSAHAHHMFLRGSPKDNRLRHSHEDVSLTPSTCVLSGTLWELPLKGRGNAAQFPTGLQILRILRIVRIMARGPGQKSKTSANSEHFLEIWAGGGHDPNNPQISSISGVGAWP